MDTSNVKKSARAGPMAAVTPRDAILALVITVGFIVFQVGADWARGVGAILAILGLVVGGAVATLIYDKLVTNDDGATANRLDASPGEVRQPAIARFLFHDTRSAPLWLAVRFYVGFAWLEAGYRKVTDSAWMGGGAALKGYWTRAVAVPAAPAKPAISYEWYRDFLQFMLRRAVVHLVRAADRGRRGAGRRGDHRRRAGRDRRLLRCPAKHELPAGGQRLDQSGPLHPRHLADARLAGRRLLGRRSLPPADPRRTLESRPPLRAPSRTAPCAGAAGAVARAVTVVRGQIKDRLALTA